MMQETWMEPRPEGWHMVHLDGNTLNNAAANLAWAPRGTRRDYVERWKANKMRELADRHSPLHGTRLAYDAGCRCQACRMAAKTAHRLYETRKTIREVERCMNMGRTCC